MINVAESYSLWLLIFIHSVILLEGFYLIVFKGKPHSQVFDISPNADNSKVSQEPEDEETNYMRFPKPSFRIFIITLKKNHLFLKVFYRYLSRCELFLEVVSKNIVLAGVIGITGIIFSAWSSINTFFAGILSGLLARIFHFLYCALEVKQGALLLSISSEDKLVIAVESEVMRRLNVHRTMRRVLGYLIMTLYYVGNMYYTIKYTVSFQDPYTYYWFIASLIGFAFVFFVWEPVKVYLQIEAVNYLKSGGSRTYEALSKFLVSEELLSTFD